VVMDVRKVAAWLGQQFSGGILASEYQWKVVYKLDLSVRHDVAVLDVDTTFFAASRSQSLKESRYAQSRLARIIMGTLEEPTPKNNSRSVITTPHSPGDD
jgi:hypothetical protein